MALTCAEAQTKRIEHRSHSGSNLSFSLNNSGNFGMVPMPFSTKNAQMMDSMMRVDSIYIHWADSLYRIEVMSREHAMQTPAKPKPGQGAAAGGAAAIGISSK